MTGMQRGPEWARHPRKIISMEDSVTKLSPLTRWSSAAGLRQCAVDAGDHQPEDDMPDESGQKAGQAQ
jgi:hypothetical protein